MVRFILLSSHSSVPRQEAHTYCFLLCQRACGALEATVQTLRIKLLDFPPLDVLNACGRSCCFAAEPAVLSQRLCQARPTAHRTAPAQPAVGCYLVP